MTPVPVFSDFIGQQLQWKRPRLFSASYELRAGDQVLATIRRAGLGKGHQAEVEGQQWNFKREGFVRRRVLIYPGQELAQASSELIQPLASIKPDRKGNGQLMFRDGRTYIWSHTGHWRPNWFWTDSASTTLITIKKNRVVEFSPNASESPDLTLLTLFGFCLILLREEDAAAAGG